MLTTWTSRSISELGRLIPRDIDQKTAEILNPLNAKPTRFYAFPKTYKRKGNSDNVPIRPVIAGCGSATERLSQFVDFVFETICSQIRFVCQGQQTSDA